MIATSNVLYAHGLVVKKVRELSLDIKVGIVLNLVNIMSLTDKSEDLKATRMREVVTNEMFYMPLLDNFEWENGFQSTYGLVAVNNDLKRIPKKSAYWYRDLIRSNGNSLLLYQKNYDL